MKKDDFERASNFCNRVKVLNKTASKVGVGRKHKKLTLLNPKSTQVAIQIMFSDKARA